MNRTCISSVTPMAQSSNHIVMVRPANFSCNEETAKTNEFQDHGAQSSDPSRSLHEVAVAEFDDAVFKLTSHGVNVIAVDDTSSPIKPDAIFPNNWFTTHQDGRCAIYPMQPETRRPERRVDVLQALEAQHGFHLKHLLDYSSFETQEYYLEGTGSLVLDRVNRVAYACESARTHEAMFQLFCNDFGYEPKLFRATGRSGADIYHTNVMMCIGTDVAVVCEDVVDERGKKAFATLRDTHHVVTISLAQMEQFAGNMLEAVGHDEERLLVMSQSAHQSLRADQIEQLERFVTLVSCPVSHIENASGGSIRCMMPEVFLPRK